MERAPLKSLGNILPNCLTLSGQKKLGIGVSQGGSQVSRQETAVHVVKPTAKHVPQQHYSDNTNGKRSRHTSESDRPGPPGTPIKPSGQSSKPGQEMGDHTKGSPNVQEIFGGKCGWWATTVLLVKVACVAMVV